MNTSTQAFATRTSFILGTSVRAIGAAMLFFAADAALAQAGTKTPDPAGSSSSVANPNEAVGVADKKAANAAVTGDIIPAQKKATARAVDDAAQFETGKEDAGEIVVTGFRRSLETAVAEKKNRDQIVESVSAEDIGKLPDASIAESIARLPGLAAQRVAGRAQSVSIRGLSPDFSSTLLNGREQTSTSDNRSVEYDQYPSEVINQVLIYKTSMASIVGQGLSGTVDLRTIRPLEYGKRVVSVGGRGTYTDLKKFNPDSTRYGYRATATYVDQFANDTIGVALSASYIDEPYQIQEFNAWGYSNGGPNGAALIGGEKSFATSTKLKRFGTTGTLEFRPVPEFTSTFDGFYSHFKDEQIKRGVELPLGFGVGDFFGTTYNPASSTVVNGVAVTGTFGGVQAIVRNDSTRNEADLYSFGWNNAYKGDNGWNAQLDLSYNKTNRSELSVESYSGTGRGIKRGATDTIGFVTTTTGSVFTHNLNYSDPGLIVLTDPAGYGGDGVNQAGYYNDRRVKDRIFQIRTEVQKEIPDFFLSSVQVGLNYTNHKKSLTPNEAFVTLPNGQQEAAVPTNYLKGTADFAYSGLGPVLAYNPFELLNAGVLTLIPRPTAVDVLSKAYTVQENLMTGYVQANINQDIGASKLTGNIGVQFVETEQKSSGLVFTPTGFLNQTYGADYLDVLPSANLSLRLPTGFIVRAAVSRETVRPRLDDLKLALNYGVDTSGPVGVIRGTAGNPTLRPYRATAYDVTVERYFGNKGYLAVQGFYKSLDSFIFRNQEQPYNFAGLPLAPGGIIPPTTIGTIVRPINVSGGKLYGVEIAGTLPLGQIVSALDGFGLTGGGSYTKTEIAPSPGQSPDDFPGYSRWVANGTAFFEKWGFSTRGSVRYRSSFIGEVVGFGGDRAQRRALNELLVDGQVGYDFSSGVLRGLSVYIQGQNLTDERFSTVTNNGNPLAVVDYQKYGRRFQAGFTYKF